jgi:hypothetical protein
MRQVLHMTGIQVEHDVLRVALLQGNACAVRGLRHLCEFATGFPRDLVSGGSSFGEIPAAP